MRIPGKLLSIYFITYLLVNFSSCKSESSPTLIAISRASVNYINWLKKADSTIEVVDLYSLPVDSALEVLEKSSGLLLTGGEDIFPGIYGDARDTSRCGTLDLYRDTLEINLIFKALEMELPVFGICRGEQILNVVFGGELFIDLPQDFDTSVRHQCDNYLTCFHMVHVEHGSSLHKFCNCDSALVTSNHHQGVKRLAADLSANAFGPDGLIEGIELKEQGTQPFFLAVQWHPERMEEMNPLSGPLANAFVSKCISYYHKR